VKNLLLYKILFNLFKYVSKIEESSDRRIVQVKFICQGGYLPRVEETAVKWQVLCYDVRQDIRSARGEPDVQERKQLCHTAFILVHGCLLVVVHFLLGHRTIVAIYSRLASIKKYAQSSLPLIYSFTTSINLL
jgi:hypothetical protein